VDGVGPREEGGAGGGEREGHPSSGGEATTASGGEDEKTVKPLRGARSSRCDYQDIVLTGFFQCSIRCLTSDNFDIVCKFEIGLRVLNTLVSSLLVGEALICFRKVACGSGEGSRWKVFCHLSRQRACQSSAVLVASINH
jgi:hypothetical protein